jgi:hypothetical protein
MAEEVQDAARTLPRSMLWSVNINGLMGWITAITFCYCIGDLDTGEIQRAVSVFLRKVPGYSPMNSAANADGLSLYPSLLQRYPVAPRDQRHDVHYYPHGHLFLRNHHGFRIPTNVCIWARRGTALLRLAVTGRSASLSKSCKMG